MCIVWRYKCKLSFSQPEGIWGEDINSNYYALSKNDSDKIE